MREGLLILPARYQDIGITPAYAGRTQNPNLQIRWSWDHPRLCGKDLLSRFKHLQY